MMIRRNTWILLAVFVVLVGAAFFIDRSKISLVQETPTPTTVAPLLSEWPLDTLTELKFRHGDQEPIDLKKNDQNNWYSVSIQSQQVNQGSIAQVVASLTSLKSIAQVDLSPETEETGLKNPAATLELIRADGVNKVLTIGNVTRTESGYYARLSDHSKVVILEKGAVEEIFTALAPEQVFVKPPTTTTESTATPIVTP